MIVATFLNLIYGVLYLITSPIRLLPDVSLPSGFQNAITNASDYIYSLDFLIPISTIFDILYLYLAVELAYLSYKLIMWLIKRFPSQS